MEQQAKDNWQPLESNPEVLNSYCTKIGFETGALQFQDVLSTDDWALEMIGAPCVGLLLVFPMNEKHKKELLPDPTPKDQLPQDLFYMHQLAKNACGTVGLYHIIGNLPDDMKASFLQPGSILANFFENSKGRSYEELADLFMKDDKLKSVHSEAVHGGDSEVTEKVDNHFVAFVMRSGTLYELDGRKKGPIHYGTTTQETFLADACGVVRKEYMDKDPENMNFGLIALGGLPA